MTSASRPSYLHQNKPSGATDSEVTVAADAVDEIRSFGRRRTRKATARQQNLLDFVMPRYMLDVSAPLRSLPTSLFEADVTAIWLEIGFGGGEHLIWQAAKNPHIGFIGCEPFIDGTIKVLDAIEAQGLTNILLYNDDARHVMRWLPQESVSRVFVLFPDPWPKKRHNKRRLVNPATLNLIAKVMHCGAELRAATDIEDYAKAMLLAFQKVECLAWTAQRAADWRIRPPDWPETRYERKALIAGRRCYYFRFKKTG